MGEFKGGKLNGLGRVYNKSGWFYEGTYEDDLLVRGKVCICAKGLYDSTYTFEVPEKRVNFAVNHERPSADRIQNKMTYRILDSEENPHSVDYKGAQIVAAMQNKEDFSSPEKLKEIETLVKQLIEACGGEDIKKFLGSGMDARDYIGLSQDPMMHKTYKEDEQYRIVRVIEKLRKYEVVNKDGEETNDDTSTT